MNYEELIIRLPKHPYDVMQNSFGKTATVNCFYLYENHQMHHDFYESHVWIFNGIEEFVEFLPVIVFSDIAINCENEDFIEEYGELDYTDRFNYYKSLLARDWNDIECKKFIDEHKGTSEMQFIEFGKVSDLINISQEHFDKCQNVYNSIDELTENGLSEGTYKIIHKFQSISNLIPAENKESFLSMLEDWGNS
jgi:hypothetical protein